MPLFFRCIATACLLPLASPIAQAACAFYPEYGPQEVVMHLPGEIIVDNAGPVGSVLHTQQVNGLPTSLHCEGGEVLSVGWLTPMTAGGGEGVYASNLPGVGLQLTQLPGPEERVTWPPTTRTVAGETSVSPGSGYWLKLIKTGPLYDGTLELAGLGAQRQYGTLASHRLRFAAGPVRIVAQKPTCEVHPASRQVRVSMGGQALREFKGIGSLGPKRDFELRLACRGGAGGRLGVHVSLTDVNDPGNRSAVLSLGAEASAGGVGLQLQRADGGLVHYGADSAQLGNPGQWRTGLVASGESSHSIALSARYIQTQAQVTPGTAPARATFTLAYD
ncbi:fimbrial protein [Pseudomonas abieticivorans]|uniref:fimbrial protein n=1 Tax=Pseudomonas abieticivorans TaxID=2931382 RepID=UPI00209B0F4E|nr:fimbrial protein [Pseudomonas sp. PIA16]